MSETDDSAEKKEKVDPWTAPVPKEASSPPAQGDGGKGAGDDRWAREALERIARQALDEQRRSRRWNIFFRAAFLIYGLLLLVLIWPQEDGVVGAGPHTALVAVEGVISADSQANADDIVAGLRAAFEHKGTRGVVIRFNSPGGSPVQAAKVYEEIRRLKQEHPDIPVIAVAEELCASAAYYMAVAADQIYANGTSLVGSIGVLYDGFGFVGTMDKLGVERRLLTAGEHKGFLDPFSPLKESDAEHMRALLLDTYDQFVQAVKTGRGDRLKEDPQIFSGWVWTGRQAKELGLVDGLGSVGQVAREVIKAEKVVDFTRREGYLDRLARRIGSTFADQLASRLLAPQLR